MSVHVSSWCWRHSQSNGNDRLVLLTIADMASDDGTNAWPSYATIADRCRISERTAIRCVDRLQELGELAVEHRAGPPREGRTRQRSNVYSFPAYRIHEGLEPKRCQSVTPSLAAKEVTPEAERGDKPRQRGDTAVSQDPSFDSSLDPSLSSRADAHAHRAGEPLTKSGPRTTPSENEAVGSADLFGSSVPGVGSQTRRRKSATPPPETFELTARNHEWFADQGLAALGVDLKLETEQFLDHHKAKDSRFADWTRAWQTWMRNAGRFARDRQGRTTVVRGGGHVSYQNPPESAYVRTKPRHE